MKPSQDPLNDSDSRVPVTPAIAPSADGEFEQELEAVERSLQDLKQRYTQVQQDQQQQAHLQQRLTDLSEKSASPRSPELATELQTIQQQLDELEISLESRLISWNGCKEVFWQAVRFCGVGIVIGWSLAFYTLKNPDPPTQSPASAPALPPTP